MLCARRASTRWSASGGAGCAPSPVRYAPADRLDRHDASDPRVCPVRRRFGVDGSVYIVTRETPAADDLQARQPAGAAANAPRSLFTRERSRVRNPPRPSPNDLLPFDERFEVVESLFETLGIHALNDERIS